MVRVEIKPVQAWQCCRCQALHATEKEAHDCCACDKCGGRFNRTSNYSKTCDGCEWGMRVRAAKAEIRRNRMLVTGSERNLAGLLASKPKKAAKVDGVTIGGAR